MTELAFTRCIRPTVSSRRISTYTIMGFGGYLAANLVGSVLASTWSLTVGERLIAFLVPPLAFLVVVTIASAMVGRERIVFYQTTVAGLAAVVLAGVIASARISRLLDVVALGIGVFLVFGRIGCMSVACCHGTLARRGIVYGPPHVAVGFWRRWSGRALVPVQAIEAVASALLVAIAIAASDVPGRAALVYIVGYAACRFALELVRGDGARPYAYGLSEAQWFAIATAVACTAWRPGVITLSVAAALVVAATALAVTRRRRELWSPPHLHELDRVLGAAADGARHATSLGVAVSRHALPDGRIDWVLSAEHPAWGEAAVRRLAHAMWTEWELVNGRTSGLIHVLTRAQATTATSAPASAHTDIELANAAQAQSQPH